jgi:hypothetical protein
MFPPTICITTSMAFDRNGRRPRKFVTIGNGLAFLLEALFPLLCLDGTVCCYTPFPQLFASISGSASVLAL